jgi:hypothetical protein
VQHVPVDVALARVIPARPGDARRAGDADAVVALEVREQARGEVARA